MGVGVITTSVVMRSVLALPLLVLITRWRTVAAWGRSVPHPVELAVVAGAFAYLLNPFAWEGRALLAQLITDAGIVTALLDAVVWLAAVLAGALWASGRDRRRVAATPYG